MGCVPLRNRSYDVLQQPWVILKPPSPFPRVLATWQHRGGYIFHADGTLQRVAYPLEDASGMKGMHARQEDKLLLWIAGIFAYAASHGDNGHAWMQLGGNCSCHVLLSSPVRDSAEYRVGRAIRHSADLPAASPCPEESSVPAATGTSFGVGHVRRPPSGDRAGGAEVRHKKPRQAPETAEAHCSAATPTATSRPDVDHHSVGWSVFGVHGHPHCGHSANGQDGLRHGCSVEGPRHDEADDATGCKICRSVHGIKVVNDPIIYSRCSLICLFTGTPGARP